MKVRHKKLGVELEINNVGTVYYITKGGSCIHRDDLEWEFVKDEEWEDVTGAYSVVDETDGGCVASDGHYVVLTKTCDFHKGMRLRKIDGMHNGPAFIIEQKKG